MIISILKDAEKTWRKIVKLARPIDSDKPVIIGSNKKSQSDFEAYTDDRKIFINLNDEKKFRKNFEDIVVPAYKIAANQLYDVKKNVSNLELLTNLLFDTFLFVNFHEQFHPWLCPNSKEDERKLSKSLYEGIKKAEPHLTKPEAMYKTNNCKNMTWDVVLNISFISKTSGYNHSNLEQKIGYVFTKDNRQIEYQPITHYPSGILPVLYMVSAKNKTTDIPLSLIGSMYATMSYNNSKVRENAMKIFFNDLKNKKLDEKDALEILKSMYKGFISEIDNNTLKEIGVDKHDYLNRISKIDNVSHRDYESHQKYFISTLTKIFDSPSMRYKSLKGFIEVLSPYISLSKKQGSFDQNTSGGNPSDAGSRPEDSRGETKSQEEMDEDSMTNTLDDLLGTLDEKEAGDLMEDISNSISGSSAGRPSRNIIKKVSIMAADEYYKKNAYVIEIHNPSEENISFDLGNKKVWRLIRSSPLTEVQVSKLNHAKIINFQNKTGLPVLMDLGNGFYKLNEYETREIPLKSYTTQKTGIEIPDNWVLFQDSSSSMTSFCYVGSKNRFDILNRVKYGIMKGLYKVCRKMGKDVNFGIVNFSDTTQYKGLDSLIKIYESKKHPIKEVSLIPQCGGTCLNPGIFKHINKELKPGKTIYTLITDGQINQDTSSLYREINKFSSKKDNAFIFIEVDLFTPFGEKMKKLSKTQNSVIFHHVDNIKSIEEKLSSVLIKYD